MPNDEAVDNTRQPAAGYLKIYFGYAPGVGKTYQMLEKARELQTEGTDIVVGFLDSQHRSDLVACSECLELIPPRRIPFRGGSTEEMDVPALLNRRPEVCVVDDLAHANVPGCEQSKRWTDVQVLRKAGINVLTTMNVQDLASLSDQVWHITGLRVRKTVPDWIFQQADEVIAVDVTPRALLHRWERGALYPPNTKSDELEAIFQEPTLVALRELALRQTAQALAGRQERKAKSLIRKEQQHLLVSITPDLATAMVLRRARHVADYWRATCVALYIHKEQQLSHIAEDRRRIVERHLQFAQDLGIETILLQSKHPARALADFAHERGITQLFVCRKAKPKRWHFPVAADWRRQLLSQVADLEVTLVAEKQRYGSTPSPYPEDEAGALMHSSYVRLSPELTVDAAIAEIRRQASHVEMISYGYVLDSSDHLTGVVSLRELLSFDRQQLLGGVMRKEFSSAGENAHKEEVAQLISRNRLSAIPVLDQDRRMRGIISSSDLFAIVREATDKDIQKIGGMEALDGPYLKTAFRQMIRKRAGWLALLFLGETLTATAMGHFSDEISRAAVLALFLPLIISSGGNSGSQATTLVIRAMAVGELRLRDWWRVVSRELMTGFVLGLILGVIGIGRILLWQAWGGTYGIHFALVALTIGCSLIGVVMFGTFAGATLPFVLRSCRLDPASASAPFVATLVDVTGLIIYFTVAGILLRGTLL